ncbi:MAG: hypothetical protein GX050_00540 [Firmicutes bacterium]|nr:hypothetical protein [Bacillota bacterium]
MNKFGLCLVFVWLLCSFFSSICWANDGASSPVGFWPANGAKEVCVDVLPKLTFDAPPVVGEKGRILICRAKDDKVVDQIVLEDPPINEWDPGVPVGCTTKFNIIGKVPGATRARIVNYDPVLLDGNTVIIAPHNNRLQYNTEYYLLIEPGVLTGTIEGQPFEGITAKGEWGFKTKRRAPRGTTFQVNADGTADFCTVQGAIDAIPVMNKTPYTIEIAAGVYPEMLYIADRYHVTLRGEDRETTIIRYKNYDRLNSGSGEGTPTPISDFTRPRRGGRSVLLVQSANGLVLENLTIENTHGPKNQAETICLQGGPTDRYIAKYCNFLSYQDTIQANARAWFYQCLISGDVDFIWGTGTTVLFEECELRVQRSNCYIVQARTPQADNKGFVFLHCDITVGGDYSGITLARSGGKSHYYDNVAYIKCRMGDYITDLGWFRSPLPNPRVASATSGWKEYQSMDFEGNPIDLHYRFEEGSYQLTDEEYETYYKDRQTIFGDWNPQP